MTGEVFPPPFPRVVYGWRYGLLVKKKAGRLWTFVRMFVCDVKVPIRYQSADYDVGMGMPE